MKTDFLKSSKLLPAALAGLLVVVPAAGGKLGNIFGGTAHAQDSAHAATLPPDVQATPTSHPPGQQAPKLEKEMTALEKGDAVRRYSINNDGVGVFINLAKEPELPPERLVKAIEINFANKGIPIDLRTNVSRGNLTTVTFFVDGTPFTGEDGDGYTLSKVESGFNTVVRAFEQHQAKKQKPGELHSAIR